MNLINIDLKEWVEAENFFYTHQTCTHENMLINKLKRKEKGHSFIKVGDVIFALANSECANKILGAGRGRVKLAQDQNGENYAVKIKTIKDAINNGAFTDQIELEIMRVLDQLKSGEATICRYSIKKQETRLKKYIVMKQIEGEDLYDYLMKANHSEPDRIEIALRIGKEIKKIHNLNIIHADIKAENFMIDRLGNVHVIDFDLSKVLCLGEAHVQQEVMGTPGFVAPEIAQYGLYSFASDIYALGVLMAHHLRFINETPISPALEWMIFQMVLINPNHRPTLDQVMECLQDPDRSLSKREWVAIRQCLNMPLYYSKQGIHRFYLHAMKMHLQTQVQSQEGVGFIIPAIERTVVSSIGTGSREKNALESENCFNNSSPAIIYSRKLNESERPALETIIEEPDQGSMKERPLKRSKGL